MGDASGEGGNDEAERDDEETDARGWTSELGPLLERGEHKGRPEVHYSLGCNLEDGK